MLIEIIYIIEYCFVNSSTSREFLQTIRWTRAVGFGEVTLMVPGFNEGDVLMHRPHLRDLPAPAPLASGVSLRQVEPEDERSLAELLERVFLQYGERWDKDRVRHVLTEASDVNAVYAIFWQGQPVATTSSQYLPEYADTAGFVHWVATHPDFRGKSLASALLIRVLTDFKERGYDGAWLITQPDRIPAIRTYLKFGFVPEYKANGADHRSRWSAIFPTVLNK